VLKADLARVDTVVASGFTRSLAFALPMLVVVSVGFYFLSRSMVVRPLLTLMHQIT
jgi:hypothetical protein